MKMEHITDQRNFSKNRSSADIFGCRVATIFFILAVLVVPGKSQALIETIESDHPYKHEADISGTFALTSAIATTGGVPCLRILIDPRSATESGFDYFSITREDGNLMALDGDFGEK